MLPTVTPAVSAAILAHQAGPIGLLLVSIPLVVLSVALRAAHVRAQRQLDDLHAHDEPGALGDQPEGAARE